MRDRVFGLVVTFLLAGALPAAAQQVMELPASDQVLNPNFEDVFRVGSFDAEEWATFGGISGVAFDDQGHLYIFDRQASRVTVVGGDGRFVREFGQPGEGPGELRMPQSFTVMRDGTTVVADMGHRAYSLFDAQGEYTGMVGMGEGDIVRIGEMQPDPRGGGVIMGGGSMSMSMRGGPGGMPEPPTTRPVEHIRLHGDEAGASLIVDAWLPPRGDDRPQELSGGGVRIAMATGGPRTFEPGLYTGVLPDGGLVYSDSSAYHLKVLGADGTLRHILHRPLQPRPVTEAMQEAEKERQLTELEAGDGPRMSVVMSGPGGGRQSVSQDAIREMMRSRVEQLRFYPELPVLQGLATGWEGTIWVERRGEEPVGPGPIDLLQSDGEYIGTFAAGVTEIPMAFGPDGLVAFVETDEFDVPTVVVRHIPQRIR